MNEGLQLGSASRDITPPAGEPMAAFPESHRPMTPRLAAGAHDPLCVRATALSDGRTTVVICVADVLTFQWPDVDLIRQAFADRTGHAAEDLVLCATHNHSGPECSYLFGGRPDSAYIGSLREQVVDAAVASLDQLVAVTVSSGAVEADLVHNRRRILPDGRLQFIGPNPNRESIGPVDPRVSVVRFDAPGGPPQFSFVNFAAHPVVMTRENRLFTAEYPGATLRSFGEQTGVGPCAFLQGGCGDTHPYQALADDFSAVDALGDSLGAAAAEAWRSASPEKGAALAVDRWQVELPNRVSPDHCVRIEITAVRLSPGLAMVFWQGEPFVELSLVLQWRSPFARTIVSGYAQGWIGYVPNRRAYEHGGYGVDRYELDPPEFSRTAVPVGAGERIVDETASLLTRLKETD